MKIHQLLTGGTQNNYPYDLFLTAPTLSGASSLEISRDAARRADILKLEISQLKTQVAGLAEELTTNKAASNAHTVLTTLLKSKQSQLDYILHPIRDDQKTQELLYRTTVNNKATSINNRGMDIIQFYNEMFDAVAKSNPNDPRLALSIWQQYLNQPLSQSYGMIFPNLNQKVNEDTASIAEFYQKVSDYIEQRSIYADNINDNPIIKEEMDEIIYVVNLILTPAIRTIILTALFEAVSSDHYPQIMQTQYNGLTLDEYLYNELPKLAYSYYTTIFTNEDDPKRKITSSSELYRPILRTITSTPGLDITMASPVITDMETTIIPFISDTYQNLIHHLRLAIYTYDKYLLGSAQITQILASSKK